jgi:hypothetical protein
VHPYIFFTQVPEGLQSEAESLTMFSGPSQTQLGAEENFNRQEMVRAAKAIENRNPSAIIFMSKTYINTGCPVSSFILCTFHELSF